MKTGFSGFHVFLPPCLEFVRNMHGAIGEVDGQSENKNPFESV